jgi:hypothetical protein
LLISLACLYSQEEGMVEYARNVSIGYMRIDVSSVGGKGSAEKVLLEVGGGKFVIF